MEKEQKMINLTIDGVKVTAPEGTTILNAAKQIGAKIPTLCYHPYLSTEGRCRICIVEVKGARDFIASCAYPISEGMEVKTHTPEIREARRDIVELILDNHPDECHTCERDSNCELQKIAYELGVREKLFSGEKKHYEKDESSHAIIRDPDKCILCGRCTRVCSEIQGVNCLSIAHRGFHSVVMPAFDQGMIDSVCISCGQCLNVCPTAAFLEKDYTDGVWAALNDPNKVTVVQVAPAIRAAIGEGFGNPPGTNMEKKIVTALKRLGFNYVFDGQFTADLTIIEEASELIHRIQDNKKLPLITSCSPGWVNFVEKFYPEMVDNLSTCMSPMGMMGSLIKRYFPTLINRDPKDMYSVGIMPCTAKKEESMRPQLKTEDGLRYVDAVLTTRELIWMIKAAGIDFNALPDTEFDSPLGTSTGAATIFGASGGVMEAALRTAHFFITGTELPGIKFESIRGAVEEYKKAEVVLNGIKVRIAVASGLGNAQKLLEKVRSGEEQYEFIEVMACPGGCIGGGGQPYVGTYSIPLDREVLKKRASALYNADEMMTLRRSHENLDVKHLYDTALEKYGSAVAHHWLHTHYNHDRKPRGVCICGDKNYRDNAPVSNEPRYQELDAYIQTIKDDRYNYSYLIPVMQKAQQLFGFLSQEVMDFISVKMQIPTSRIYGVATFYHLFKLKPKGKYNFAVCLGTACYVKGAQAVITELENLLGIKVGETTEDGLYSIEIMRCFGACGLAPVMLVNDKVYGNVTPKEVGKIIKTYKAS